MFSKLPRLVLVGVAILLTTSQVRGQDLLRQLGLIGNGGNSGQQPTLARAADDGSSSDNVPQSVIRQDKRSITPPRASSAATSNSTAAPAFSNQSPPSAYTNQSPPSAYTNQAPPPASHRMVPVVIDDGSVAPPRVPVVRDSRSLQERLSAVRQDAQPDQPAEGSADSTPSSAPQAGTSSRRGPPLVADDDGTSALQPVPQNKSNGSDDDAPSAHSQKPEVARADAGPSSRRHAEDAGATPEAAPAEESASNGGVLFTRQSPLLSVETSGPRTIVIDREAAYTVSIKNSGDVAAQDVVVSVKIPAWTDLVGTQPSAGNAKAAAAESNEPMQWRIPRLDAHSKENLSVRLIPRKGRPFDLAVQWTCSPAASEAQVEVQEPKLVMNLSGPQEVAYGQSKLFRLTVSNPGSGDAENVVVQLAPVGNSSASPTTHPIGTLHAGDNKVVELELTARQSGSLAIHAVATADPGLKSEVNQEVLVRRAAVAVAIDGAKVKYAGTLASYAIQVTNPGNAVAENVKVFAALPPGAKFAAASNDGQWKADAGKVVWSFATLKPGEATTLELRCMLMSPGQNRMHIVATAAGDVNDSANAMTNVEALADLKLDVSEPAGPIAIGDEVVYELHIRNRGTKGAEGVGIVAYFSDGLDPTDAEGSAHDIANGVVAFRPATLAAGSETTYKIHARAEHGGKQVFRAEVECGALGTKLVSAEEMTIYGNDDVAAGEHQDRSVARRNPQPLPATPLDKDESPLPMHR